MGSRLESFHKKQVHEIQKAEKKPKPYYCPLAVVRRVVGFGRWQILKQSQNFPESTVLEASVILQELLQILQHFLLSENL